MKYYVPTSSHGGMVQVAKFDEAYVQVCDHETEVARLRAEADALRAMLPEVVGKVWRLVDSDGRQFGGLYDSEWHASAAQLRFNGGSTGAPFTVQRLELIAGLRNAANMIDKAMGADA